MDAAGVFSEIITPQSARRQWAEVKSEPLHWLQFVVFYAIFANFPYWIASRAFGFLPLGWFCVEYALVGLITLVVPRFVSVALLFAVILFDMLSGVCLSYYLPLQEVLANLGSARAFSAARLISTLDMILLALLAAASAYLIPVKGLRVPERLRAGAALAAFGILILSADVLSIYLATSHLPGTLVKLRALDSVDLNLSKLPRIARFQVYRLAKSEAGYARVRSLARHGGESAFAVPGAIDIAVKNAGLLSGGANSESPNLVLVMVESWGLAVDTPLKEALVQPYAQPNLLARYTVTQGTVPFNGPTIAGEARELCGNGFGFYILIATQSDLKDCLPNRLAAAGYDTVSAHGMSGHMFDRAIWYRTIGFKERWFHDQFKQEGLPDCVGAFAGTCDADIAAWIGKRLDEENVRPYFVHWMTLNSHLPVLVPSPLANGAPCMAAFSLIPKSALCSWYQLIANVHQSVAQLALGPHARPTIFVIVGDHAPPFADPALRARFSYEDVPYVILMPRNIEHESKNTLAQISAGSLPQSSKLFH